MSQARRIRLAIGSVGVIAVLAGCTSPPTPPPPTRPPVALAPVGVTEVGDVPRGGASKDVLVLTFTEAGAATIATGAGSFEVTLTDSAGYPDPVGFTGTPSIAAPGSLGATAKLIRSNVLMVEIVDSDTFNIESVTITGIGIKASPTAALGPINAVINGCVGSLAGCTATNVLTSPGAVVAAP